MPPPGSLALAAALALLGPPKLPPLPGEGQRQPPPSEPAPAKPTTPAPAKPRPAPAKPRPAPAQPTPAKPPARPTAGPPPPPAAPPPSPAPEPSTVPAAAKPKSVPGGLPDPTESGEFELSVIEPPQPEATGPEVDEPEVETADGERKSKRKRKRGPGEAPSMDDDGMLPGGEDEPSFALRFPPPVRPPYSGTGLMIGAGISFAASLSEQIVAHVLVKRRCIEPFAATQQPDPENPEQLNDQGEDFAQALVDCAPGVLPAVALRIYSDFGLLATIGLAAGGAAMRARQRAYDDVFADRTTKPMVGLRIAGGSLIGVGVVTWLTTGALSWGMLASCRDAKCATRARLMAFTTRDAGAVMIAGGAGMLAYSFAHRRGYERFFRERVLSVGTAYLPGGAGLSLSGRF